MYKEMPFVPAHKMTTLSQQSIASLTKQPSNDQIQELIRKNVNVILDPLNKIAGINL